MWISVNFRHFFLIICSSSNICSYCGRVRNKLVDRITHAANLQAQRLEQQIAEHANSNPGVAKADDKKKKSEGKDDKFFEKDYADDDPAEDAEPQADSRWI